MAGIGPLRVVGDGFSANLEHIRMALAGAALLLLFGLIVRLAQRKPT